MALLRSAGLVLALGLSLTACSSLNPFSRSTPKPAPLADFTPTVQATEAWHVSVAKDGRFRFVPAVASGSVYVAGPEGRVMRVDADGATDWRVDTDRELSSGVASDGRMVVVVAQNGDVLALDANDGHTLWTHNVNAEVLAPAALGEGVVVLRSSDHRLIALDRDGGKQRWVYQRQTPPLALRSFTGVTISGDVVVAGFPGGKLAGIKLDSGASLWELTVAQPRGTTELERMSDVVGEPLLSYGELCAVAYQGRAACFDGRSGTSKWSRDLSSAVGMSRTADTLFITDEDNRVLALDSTSGTTKWEQRGFSFRGLTRPVVVDDVLAVGDSLGYVHLLSQADGRLVGRVRVDSSGIAAAPVPFEHGFVVQSRSGDVYAYRVH